MTKAISNCQAPAVSRAMKPLTHCMCMCISISSGQNFVCQQVKYQSGPSLVSIPHRLWLTNELYPPNVHRQGCRLIY